MVSGFFPLDDALDLLPGSYSPFVHECIVRLGTWLPFEQVPAALLFLTGVQVDAETVRRLTEQAGAALVVEEDAEAERLALDPPDAAEGPAIQQFSADGTMVPLVGGEWTEVKTLALGTVTTDAEGGVHTADLSYFSRHCSAEEFRQLTVVATHERGTERAGTVCAVMDGADWLQGLIDFHRPDAIRILDFPHAAEHLGTAAQATFGSGSVAGAEWLTTQLHQLKHGDPDAVLAAVKKLPVTTDAAIAVRDRELAYLTARRRQIAYATFRDRGLPIGSGIVESACKLVVQARLKGSGMHWAVPNVSPMVALRAAWCSQRWDRAWQVVRRHHRTCRDAQHAQRAHPRPRSDQVTSPSSGQPAAPTPPPSLPQRPPRPACVVDGRPTKDHPWHRIPACVNHRSFAKS